MRGFRERGVSRRAVLLSSVAASLLTGLAACQTTPVQKVALTKLNFSDLSNVLAGAIHVSELPAWSTIEAAAAAVSADIDKATQALSGLKTFIGAAIPATSAAALFADLKDAVSVLAQYFPDSPYVIAVQVLLQFIGVVWNLSTGLTQIAASQMSLTQARNLLGALRRPI